MLARDCSCVACFVCLHSQSAQFSPEQQIRSKILARKAEKLAKLKAEAEEQEKLASDLLEQATKKRQEVSAAIEAVQQVRTSVTAVCSFLCVSVCAVCVDICAFCADCITAVPSSKSDCLTLVLTYLHLI